MSSEDLNRYEHLAEQALELNHVEVAAVYAQLAQAEATRYLGAQVEINIGYIGRD